MKRVENIFDNGIVKISFDEYYEEKQIMSIKIGNELSESFIGKFERPKWIAKYIQEGNLNGLIHELQYGKYAEAEAYYYLLGYIHTKRIFQKTDEEVVGNGR